MEAAKGSKTKELSITLASMCPPPLRPFFPQSRTSLLTERAIKLNKNYHKLVCATQARFITEAQFTPPTTVKTSEKRDNKALSEPRHVNDSCLGHVDVLRHDPSLTRSWPAPIVTIAVGLWKFLNPTFSRYSAYDWPSPTRSTKKTAVTPRKPATMRCVRPHDDGNTATTSARRDNV